LPQDLVRDQPVFDQRVQAPRATIFVVASDTATGCRTIATKEVSEKRSAGSASSEMLGGDFSSR